MTLFVEAAAIRDTIIHHFFIIISNKDTVAFKIGHKKLSELHFSAYTATSAFMCRDAGNFLK
jgi:hypothetical protein